MEKFIEILQNYSEYEDISASCDFKKDLGLSSFDTVCLIDEIKTVLGKEPTATDFVRFHTVGEFYENILK